MSKYENVIIAVGGGVVDWQESVNCLKNGRSIPKIYIEK
jgi:shikimate kinase